MSNEVFLTSFTLVRSPSILILTCVDSVVIFFVLFCLGILSINFMYLEVAWSLLELCGVSNK